MAKYVFSYRVPPDYRPSAETPGEWQAWFGGLGSALVDVGHAVTDDYASLGEVGGSGSRMVGYSVVSTPRTWTPRWHWPRTARRCGSAAGSRSAP